MNDQDFLAMGLMSGTSRDGIDAALVRTNGHWAVPHGPFLTLPYGSDVRHRLQQAIEQAQKLGATEVPGLEHDITILHAQAVHALLAQAGIDADAVDVIGFHGHTLRHLPAQGRTWAIGDGQQLANLVGRPVVAQMRIADMAAGGQGAPLAPLYHRARMGAEQAPHAVAIVNLGGVANVTWIGPGEAEDRALLAFDTGPGNGLMDDWAQLHGLGAFDQDGRAAAAGTVHMSVLDQLLDHPYFDEAPPKSLDRDDFSFAAARSLTVEDGAATLCAFTVQAVVAAQQYFPEPVAHWYMCGGGCRNAFLMAQLGQQLAAPIHTVQQLGWRPDAIEAEAFAFLAARSVLGLPLSLPTTTGVSKPTTGGIHFKPVT